MKYTLLSLVFILTSALTWADCTNPAQSAGAVLYSADQNALIFCDGTTWRLAGQDVADAASTGCTTPTGAEGAVIYEATTNQMQFCNGEKWVAMGPSNASAASTGCTSPTGAEGSMAYSGTANWLQYCDGENWVNAGQLNVIAGATASCPSGFVFIPGSAGVDSQAAGWCVSKYEMTPDNTAEWTQDTSYYGWRFDNTASAATKYVAAKPNQTPITYVSHDEAATACGSYLKDGDGNTLSDGKLITVELWSMLAQDITDVGENWSGGSVGSGYMSRGHSNGNPSTNLATGADVFPATTNMTSSGNEYWSRTYKTSNGDIIWDLAGNTSEWFNDLHNGGADNWRDHNAGTFTFDGIALEASQGHYSQTQGVGRIYSAASGATPGSNYAAIFGGNWYNTANSGLWASHWHPYSPSTSRYYGFGFRCIAPAS